MFPSSMVQVYLMYFTTLQVCLCRYTGHVCDTSTELTGVFIVRQVCDSGGGMCCISSCDRCMAVLKGLADVDMWRRELV